ncbi:MAG: pilus assembly protein TadG-related protein [Sphingomicrobium sp.]
MIKLLRKIWNNRSGNAIVIAGAMLPLVIGCAGLATDTIQWTLWKRQLQRAADSAAIAGAYDRQGSSGATTNTSTAVAHDLALNLHMVPSLLSGYPQLAYPANSGVSTNQVNVMLAVQQSLPFSGMFMTVAPTIRAVATAATVPGAGDACVQALETNASNTGIAFNGNASIYMPDCDGFSNSPSTNTSFAKGSSDVTMDSIGGVGGIQQSNNFHVNSYRPYSPALVDPFLGVVPQSSDMACNATTITSGNSANGNGNGATTTSSTGPVALSDSTVLPYVDSAGKMINCFSSLSVGSNRTLTLPDGIYYINAGDANIQGNLSCNSCTIVLTNSSSSNTATIGQLKVNASSQINVTAPTTGTYAGIAFYQDRRAVDSNANVNKINGNSNSVITGAIYFPNQQLEYNGTGNTTAVCTMFVARRVVFTGNSSTSNKFKSLDDCALAGLPKNTILMVRLIA